MNLFEQKIWLENRNKDLKKFRKAFAKQNQGNNHIDILETLSRTEKEIRLNEQSLKKIQEILNV